MARGNSHNLLMELSHCIQLDVAGHPLELLPELQELTYSGSGDADGVLPHSLMLACQNAGRPVTLIKL
jgi:hypothetical protein